MKTLIITLLTVFSCSQLFAQELNPEQNQSECNKWQRAIETDQRFIFLDVVFDSRALDLVKPGEVKQIFTAQMSDYVSWKVNQVGCMADVVHKANLRVTYYKPNLKGTDFCETIAVINKKDFFSNGESYSEYKIRDRKDYCEAASDFGLNMRKKCSQVECPKNMYPQAGRMCECTLAEDFVDIERGLQEQYADFFNPNKEFKKPEGVVSPFNKVE